MLIISIWASHERGRVKYQESVETRGKEPPSRRRVKAKSQGNPSLLLICLLPSSSSSFVCRSSGYRRGRQRPKNWPLEGLYLKYLIYRLGADDMNGKASVSKELNAKHRKVLVFYFVHILFPFFAPISPHDFCFLLVAEKIQESFSWISAIRKLAGISWLYRFQPNLNFLFFSFLILKTKTKFVLIGLVEGILFCSLYSISSCSLDNWDGIF